MRFVGIGLGAIIVIAAFLPWFSATVYGGELPSTSGVGAVYGVITLLCGIVLILHFSLAGKGWLSKILSALVGGVAAYFPIHAYREIEKMRLDYRLEDPDAVFSSGAGLWMTVVASLLAIITIFIYTKKAKPLPERKHRY